VKLKVWQGISYYSAGQQHCIVVARSQKRAVEVLHERGVRETLGHFSNYWSESGSDAAKHFLGLQREGAWATPDASYRWKIEDYKELKP